MKKNQQDMIIMLVLMVLSAITYLIFIPSQIKLATDASFNNRTFPQFTIIVVFLAATGGFLEALFRYLRARQTAAPGAEAGLKKADLRSNLLPLAGFAVILAYALVFHYLSYWVRGFGFIIATAIFIPVFLLMTRCKNWRYYVAAYCFAAVMYLVFRFILNVPLR